MARRTIEVGTRYTRADGSPKVYAVVDIVEKAGHLPHVRLALDGGTPSDLILVGLSALGDRKLWRPVE